jgi:hypothetical protein
LRSLDSADGEIIIESSRQPLLDGARPYEAGFSGKLEMWTLAVLIPGSAVIDKLAA